MGFEVASIGCADGDTTCFFLDGDFMIFVHLVCLDVQVDDQFVGELGGFKDDFAKGLGALNAEGGGVLGVELEVGGSIKGLPVIDGRERVLMAITSVVYMLSHAVASSRDSLGSWSMHEEVQDEESTEEDQSELEEANEEIGTLGLAAGDRCRKDLLKGSLLIVVNGGRHGCCR
jgi:hypothetical protein